MAETVTNEILCIPGKNKNYAVEFPYVQELCHSMKITPLPCLPGNFLGMTNYKGTIIPVVYLEEEIRGSDRTMILVIRHQRFMLGLVISADAFILSSGEAKIIRNLPESTVSEMWKEKQIYQVEDKLYVLIDVEKSLESLVLYP